MSLKQSLRGNTTVKCSKNRFLLQFFLDGRKDYRIIMFEDIVKHILKYKKKIFINKYCKTATAELFSRSKLNLKRSAARSVAGANLNL